jgi:hypothetical protein
MITTIAREVVNGTLALVQTVVYSNGKKVRRLLDTKTLMPIEILPTNDKPS